MLLSVEQFRKCSLAKECLNDHYEVSRWFTYNENIVVSLMFLGNNTPTTHYLRSISTTDLRVDYESKYSIINTEYELTMNKILHRKKYIRKDEIHFFGRIV